MPTNLRLLIGSWILARRAHPAPAHGLGAVLVPWIQCPEEAESTTGIESRNEELRRNALLSYVRRDWRPRRGRFCLRSEPWEPLAEFREPWDRSGGPVTEPTRSRTKSRPEASPGAALDSRRFRRSSSRLPSQATFPRNFAKPRSGFWAPWVPPLGARWHSMMSAASCNGSTRLFT